MDAGEFVQAASILIDKSFAWMEFFLVNLSLHILSFPPPQYPRMHITA